MQSDARVWLITGVSTGLGRELAKAALGRGDIVAGTLRREEQLAEFRSLSPGRAFAYRLDVTDGALIPEVVARAEREAGPVRVLVNNAGYGLFGAVEEVSEEEGRRVMETNFFGTLAVTRAVLPYMRARGSGRIVNFSSIAGFTGLPGCGLYCAAKFAVEGLSQSLAKELVPFGIKVTIVEPGAFQTNFFAGSKAFAARALSEYADSAAGKVRDAMLHPRERQSGDPARGAAAIIEAVEADDPPLHLALGADALASVRRQLMARAQDYDTWEKVTCGTGFI